MSNLLTPPSLEHRAFARASGLVLGAATFAIVISSLVKPYHWVALRQTIPVSMSLADAEKAYSDISEDSRKQIEVVNERAAGSLSVDLTSPNDLLSQLRNQAAALKTLASQASIMERQLETLQEKFEEELLAWTEEVGGVKDTAAQLDSQTRILLASEKYERFIRRAEQELLFVKKVLEDGADIQRLVAAADHEAKVMKTLGELESLTTEVTTFARKLQSTTQSVLAAWVNRT